MAVKREKEGHQRMAREGGSDEWTDSRREGGREGGSERGVAPVTMDRLGGLVQAPINCTTFLCLTFLEVG